MECRWWMKDVRSGKLKYGEKIPVAVLLSPSQISYHLPWDRTEVSALRDRRLTVRKAPYVRWIHGNPKSVYPMFVLIFEKRSIAHCWMPRSNVVIICHQLCCWLWATFLHLRAVKAVFMFFFSLLLGIPYGCFLEGSQTRIHYAFVISSRSVTCPAVCDSFLYWLISHLAFTGTDFCLKAGYSCFREYLPSYHWWRITECRQVVAFVLLWCCAEYDDSCVPTILYNLSVLSSRVSCKRYVVPKRPYAITDLRRLTSQKGEDLNYIAEQCLNFSQNWVP